MKAEDYFDQKKRLDTLYSLKDAATGRIVPFIPRPEQQKVFECLRSGVRKIIILKARRLGMSTAIGIFSADSAIFGEGRQISIIDRTQSDASLKLNGIVKIAYESLDEDVKARIKVRRDNDSSWEVGVLDQPSSTIFAGMNSRGGTNQLLHLSELGVIQADDPKRAEEIITGAIPTAEHGVTVIETTWKGGRGGVLWKIVKDAMELPIEKRTLNDWHLFFFPWWSDPTYTDEGSVSDLPEDLVKYFAEKEVEIGHKFTDGQKCWYARRKATIGIFMFREFPTTIAECFSAPVEGAIYAREMDRARAEGRVKPYAVDGGALVHTFWDEGAPINTSVWYAQFVGGEIRIIDCDCELDLTPVERVAYMKAKGYNLGNHYFTHAALQTETSGKTRAVQFQEAGLVNIRTVPRTLDIWVGINEVKQRFPTMIFNSKTCARGIEGLDYYHTKPVSSGGILSQDPVHDWSSHICDALRTMAEALMSGMVEGGSAIAKETRAMKMMRRPEAIRGLRPHGVRR